MKESSLQEVQDLSLVKQELQDFRHRAFLTILHVYFTLLFLEAVALVGYGFIGGWLVRELVIILPVALLSFWLYYLYFKGQRKLAVTLFLGLIVLVQVVLVLNSQPIIVYFSVCAAGCFVNIIFALLETPLRAFWGATIAAALINGTFLLRVATNPKLFAPFVPSILVLLGLVSFLFTMVVIVLTRWLTRGFTKALEFSQEMSTNLQQANTDLVQARDEALVASRTKSAFLANMSHELRTPLNAIIGYAELIQEELDHTGAVEEESLRKDLKKICGSGHRLLGMVDNVLDLTKIETGTLELHIQEVDLTRLCTNMEREFALEAEVKGNTLRCQIDPSLQQISTDPQRLHQILESLLSNACKFTRNGQIQMEVQPITKADESFVRFQVKDTGVGIEEEKLESLLEAFAQVDTSPTRPYEGAGLGLTVTHRITLLLGGTLSAKSTLGQGSTFIVDLPIHPPPTP